MPDEVIILKYRKFSTEHYLALVLACLVEKPLAPVADVLRDIPDYLETLHAYSSSRAFLLRVSAALEKLVTEAPGFGPAYEEQISEIRQFLVNQIGSLLIYHAETADVRADAFEANLVEAVGGICPDPEAFLYLFPRIRAVVRTIPMPTACLN